MNIQRSPMYPDYSFIERTAGIVGQTIQAYDAAKKLNVDIKNAKEDYNKLVKQARDIYMQETGETDPVKATAFVVKYFQPLTGSERNDPSKAYGRWQKAETIFKDALQKEKVRRFRQGVPTTTPAAPPTIQRTGLAGQRTTGMATPAAAPAAIPETPAAAPAPAAIPEAAPAPIVPPEGTPTVPAMATPTAARGLLGQRGILTGRTSSEMEEEARRKGIAEDPEIKAMIARQRNLEFGKTPPTGTRAARMEKTLGEYGGWTPEIKETLMQTPTEYQEMTNKRLIEAQKLKARIAALKNKYKGKKLASDVRLKIIAERNKNDRNRANIETRRTAIKAQLVRAQKDPLGQLDPTDVNRINTELDDLDGILSILDENSLILDDLLQEKGGVAPSPTRTPRKGRKPLSSFER